MYKRFMKFIGFPVKEPVKPRVFELPRDKHYEFYGLSDMVTREKDANNLAKYELWSFVEEIFPDVSEGRWKWEGNAGHVKIIEVIE